MNKLTLKFLLGTTLCATVFVGAATQLHAGITNNWYSGKLNQSSDNSAEFLIDLTPGGAAPGILEVGDVLVSISDFSTNENLTDGTPQSGYVTTTGNELTALIVNEVVAIIPTVPGTANFVFGPTTAITRANPLFTAGVPLIAAEVNSWDARSLAAIYEDPTPDYTRSGTGHDDGDGSPPLPGPADPMGAKANLPDDSGVGPFLTEDGISAAGVFGGDATRLLEVGFLGGGLDPNEYFSGVGASLNINLFETIPVATILGGVNFGVNVVPGTNNTGWTFDKVANFNPLTLTAGVSDLNASGSLLGIGPQAALQPAPSVILGASTPFDLYDNIDVVFRPVLIPEPSTLVLLGIGTILLASGRRRRRR